MLKKRSSILTGSLSAHNRADSIPQHMIRPEWFLSHLAGCRCFRARSTSCYPGKPLSHMKWLQAFLSSLVKTNHMLRYAVRSVVWVSQDNMTLIWLGNNGSPQDAKGTIQAKDTGVKYQVAITWVDGKGWKPMLKPDAFFFTSTVQLLSASSLSRQPK